MPTSAMGHESGRRDTESTEVFIITGEKAGRLIDLAHSKPGTLIMVGHSEYFCLGNAGWIEWDGEQITPTELADKICWSREPLNLVHVGA